LEKKEKARKWKEEQERKKALKREEEK